jgi:polyphosphate kinase
MGKKNYISRDISWLSFNARVLQEANDSTVPLQQRIRFLGIFSNNLDEFFRVRVASLKRMLELKGKKGNMHLEEKPKFILEKIQQLVIKQQSEFNIIWNKILLELKKENVLFVNDKNPSANQRKFIQDFFENNVRNNVIPLLIEGIPQMPYLREKSLYLGVVMQRRKSAFKQQFAIIEIPSKVIGRFILLPEEKGKKYIILLEDVIRINLPKIFSYFDYDNYESHVFKITRDAEIDFDSDFSSSFIQKIEKGLKNRRKGKPVRFLYDKEMNTGLLNYLIQKLNLSKKDNLIPGSRIHNFRHFIDFPVLFESKQQRAKPFVHPSLKNKLKVTDVILKKDIMLHFPYHSFDSLIDLLREAAMDPHVTTIKITNYRLASNSKIINALINAARNGKQVIVMLELRARFDEEANLEWKEILEEEGIKVLIGFTNMKVHAKICIITKLKDKKKIHYGFVSTGNLNEKTAKIYADHCLLTSNKNIMSNINKVFNYIENPKLYEHAISSCKTLFVSPKYMRNQIDDLINKEISNSKKGLSSGILLKINSLSDYKLIDKLYTAAEANVPIKIIVRSICCGMFFQKKFKNNFQVISIVDEYLEHARVMVFNNNNKEKVFISSADWMVRNLDHRIEVASPIYSAEIKKEIIDIYNIQLNDNVKAREINHELSNNYITNNKKKVRSQIQIYQYLQQKKYNT